MMMDELLAYLANQTSFLNLDDIDIIFTASKLAEVFHVKRNTISHYLNKLSEEGLLVKVNTRPVYYFHKETFDDQFYPLETALYQSIDEIIAEKPFLEEHQDIFSLLIGGDESLSKSIKQVKAALNYPDNGLPTLFTGESGTGKSYFVKIIYEYCVLKGLLDEDAPFITVNCAQYANNPELLTSTLFGYVKGAFTGADEQKKGAFEYANNGILFLDEIHRLNPEGQEKLFTYMDQGFIYRVGDPNQAIPLKVRLFFATTESLESSFLTTFIRRIPIQIELPPLSKRSKNERIELVYSFLIAEQRKFGKPLCISGQVLTILTSGELKGNIGELKNIVKITVAKAFSEQQYLDDIHLTIYHLPEKILDNAGIEFQSYSYQEIYIDEHSSSKEMVQSSNPNRQKILSTFENMLIEFQKNDYDLDKCDGQFKKEIDLLFDILVFEADHRQNNEVLLYLIRYMRETFNQMESSYQIRFNGNSVYALSYYMFERGSSRLVSDVLGVNDLIQKLETAIEKSYPLSYHYVERILELCQPKIDLDICSMDKIILTLYLKHVDWTKELGIPKAIIVAHGYSTASSIANVTNRFLGKDIFDSFDMPLTTTPKEIATQIMEYSEQNDISNGLIILVDMGSLKEIYPLFQERITTPVVIINNVTTSLALAVGENIQEHLTLENVMKESVAQNPFEWKVIYPKRNKMKAIITTCFTGIGTASQISHLLEKSLPTRCELKILPLEYNVLRNEQKNLEIFSKYDVLGIIGTANPNVADIPYLSLEGVISGYENTILSKWLEPVLTEKENITFNENVVRNFSLEKVIESVTILDTEKVMQVIESFIRNLEISFQDSLTNSQKIALYVHISCLIERLIRNMPIENYDGVEYLLQCHKKEISLIKKAFSVIEKDYSVKIPLSELSYIYDILFKKFDPMPINDEF